MADLHINVDKVCIAIDLSRRLAGKIDPILKGGDDVSRGEADDPGGDSPLSPMEERPGDTSAELLRDYLCGLGGDELAGLLALSWVGRGDYDAAAWDEAVVEAEERLNDTQPIDELFEDPLLADELIDGLQSLGYECPIDEAGGGTS